MFTFKIGLLLICVVGIDLVGKPPEKRIFLSSLIVILIDSSLFI